MPDVRCFDGVLSISGRLVKVRRGAFCEAVSVSETLISSFSSSDVCSCVLTRRMTYSGREKVTMFPWRGSACRVRGRTVRWKRRWVSLKNRLKDLRIRRRWRNKDWRLDISSFIPFEMSLCERCDVDRRPDVCR